MGIMLWCAVIQFPQYYSTVVKWNLAFETHTYSKLVNIAISCHSDEICQEKKSEDVTMDK